MATELRKTGISVVGDVPWGTHFCHFYETKQDLLDTLVPYFKAGLESKEFCVWVVSDSELITVEEAKGALKQAVPDLDRHLADENIEIFSGLDWYLEQGMFNLERVTNAWDTKLKRALAHGYDGMRVSGDTFWLTEKDWKDFFAYEKQLNEAITDQPMTVLCTYPLAKSGADEVLDVVQAHQFAIARRQGEWEVIETPALIQAKAEIKRLNEELEQRVIERTNELGVVNEELRKEIAERKRAEDALRQSEERFAAFMDNLPGYAWMKDLQGRYVYVNEMVRGLPGYRSLGKTDAQIWPADLAAEYRANDQQVIAAKKPLHTLEHFQLEGKHRYMAGSKFPIFDKTSAVALVGGVGVDITERIEAEETVRRSEEHLRLVIDTIPTMAWSVRPDGVVDFVNQRWMDYTGISLEEESEEPTRPIHPEDVPRVMERWLLEKQVGEPYDEEMRLRRADGEYRWFLVRTAPLRDEQGNIIKWYGVSIDIEDRKRAEEALKESQRRLEEAQRIAHVGHWDRDLETGVITWSDEIYRILGLLMQEGDSPRTEWLDVVHPEDRPRLSLAIEELERGIQRLDVEFRIVRPNGEVRFLHSQGDVIRDERGRPLRRFGTAQDITERKQAEEKLLQSERQLAEAQRLAHIGSWDWDLRTNAVTWSDELYHIFGLQPGTISVAGEVDRFIHPDDLDLGWDTVKRAVASKEPYDYYHRILRPDGTERIARSRGSIMSDERGEPIRVFGATQDVTELKRAEEKLKATTEQLRALSASVQSAREEEATRIAREIHDELGGALTSLKWDLESFDRVISESREQSQLEVLRDKIEGMLRLSETTISAVRRISSELRPSVLDDLGLAEAIEWQTRQFHDRTGITADCDCTLQNVHLNQEQSTAVFRIFQEALTNILRHAQATRVEIAMREEAGKFVLTVSDNGRGITEEDKSRLQSLGLLGMRERADLIGAEIDVAGVEAQGTVVTVRVPKTLNEMTTPLLRASEALPGS